MVKSCKGLWSKSTVLGLVLGQLLSILVAFAGFTSSQLSKTGIFAPASQCLLNYLLLALVYGSIMIYRKEPVKQPKLYYYSMLAFVDVFAKFFVIAAFSFTYLKSVMLLDYWAIPCVLFLTSLVLKTKCGLQKLIGIVICIAGLQIVFLSDLHSAMGIKAVIGDLFIIVGATHYGVSNFGQEILAKKADRVEIMAFLGFYGAFIIAPQIAMFERNEFKSILSSPWAIFLVIGFSIAMFLFYSGVSLLLKISGSTMLNLSLLTSNLWAVLIQIFGYHEKVDWIYFVALATFTFGLIVYSWGGDEMDPNNGETASLDEEVGLSHSDNVDTSNNDRSRSSFQGVRNLLCYISCITKGYRAM